MSIKAVIASQFDATGLNKATKEFNKLGGTIKGALGAIGVSLSIGEIVRVLGDASRAAVEDSKSQAILANALRNTVGANDSVIASVEESISKMQALTAVADDQIRPAFQTLATATGDVEAATKLTNLALDLAASKGIPVTTAASAIAKATTGQTTALTRLMPSLKGSTDMFGDLEAATYGAAQTAADNDPFQRMTTVMGELQEQIGYALLPTLQSLSEWLGSPEVQAALEFLIEGFNTWVGEMKNVIDGANAVGTALANVLNIDPSTAANAWNGFFSGLGRSIKNLFLGPLGSFIADVFGLIGKGQAAADAASNFKGVEFTPTDFSGIDFNLGKNPGGGNGTKATATKTAKDFVAEFYAGVEEEASKVRAGNMLEKLGLSPALVQEILGSAEWRKVFINVKNSGTTALTELQASFNKTAKGMQELADIQQELQDAVDARNEAAIAQYEEQLALYESQIEAINAFKEALAGVAKGVAPLAVVTRELGSFEQATVTAFDNITASIEQGLADGTLLKSAADNLTAYARKEQAIIQSLMRQRDAIVEKRSLAEAMLRDVKDAIVGVGNLTSFLNSTSEKVTETVTKMVGGMQVVISRTIEQVTGTKAMDLVNSFSSILAKTKAFALQLKQLRELGLDKNLYQQIVDAGIDAGGQTAAAILEGGAGTVSELNGLFSELNTVGEQIATQTAEVMYGAGVDLTNGLIAGLISQEQALVDSATTLANAFTEAFNASVSANIVMPVAPTQPIMETLQPVDTGLVTLRLGDIKLGDFGSGSAALATKLIATPQATAWNTSITINTNGVTDGTALGKLITSELNKYAKNNGITVK